MVDGTNEWSVDARALKDVHEALTAAENGERVRDELLFAMQQTEEAVERSLETRYGGEAEAPRGLARSTPNELRRGVSLSYEEDERIEGEVVYTVDTAGTSYDVPVRYVVTKETRQFWCPAGGAPQPPSYSEE